MKRLLVVGVALSVAAGLGLALPKLHHALRPDPPPNLVLIVVDTLRADHLPFYGYEVNTAPFLSRLASESLVFTRSTATSSWTAPSVASIFTSLYPFQHGVLTGFLATRRLQKEDPTITLNRIPEEIDTLPEVLREGGYRTFGVADNLNICAEEGFDQGFDRFVNFNYETAERVNRQVLEWRQEIVDGTGPYFLYVHYMDPHGPYRQRAPWYRPPDDPELEPVAAYDSEIGFVDSKIAELFDRFGWEGDGRTVVVLTADHGEEFRDHGGVTHGKTLYAEVLDVPLVIYGPGRVASGRSEYRASGIDVLPTLRSLAGLSPSEHDEGVDLLAAVGSEPRGPVFAHVERRDPKLRKEKDLILEGAVLDDWKYIRDQLGNEDLYDLASDPGELTDLAAERPPRVRELRAALQGFRATCRTYDREENEVAADEQLLDDLRSLGYVQ